MTRRARLALLALTLAAPLAARGEPPAVRAGPGWTVLAAHRPAIVEELYDEGHVVLPADPSDDGFVRAMAIFEQPRAVVMALLTDYARQPEFQSDLVGFAIVAPLDGGGVVAEHRIRILFRDLNYRVRHRHEGREYRLSWSLDPEWDNDLAAMRGSWELHVLDSETTLGSFATLVAPGGLVTPGMARRVTRLKVPENLGRLRSWVNQEGGAR